jgi:hypothetical protein
MLLSFRGRDGFRLRQTAGCAGTSAMILRMICTTTMMIRLGAGVPVYG